MKARYYVSLFFLGLAIVFIPAKFETVPGYMDAEYYYAGGLRLADGYGFSELFLWNYLDNPTGLPHPSHAYWMPLVSLVVAAGIKILGSASFSRVQIVFMLIAACLPPLTAALSYSLHGRRNPALLSGLLASFPAFYLPYLPTTDTFGIYMLLGVLFMLVVGKLQQDCSRNHIFSSFQFLWLLALGGLAGLMHLARADGILWLFFSCVVIVLLSVERSKVLFASERKLSKNWGLKKILFDVISKILFCLAGYLIVMGPWIVRNMTIFGAPFSPGGLKALWINNYDELYIYPGSLLTPSHWLSNGILPILQARWWALGQNLISTMAVQGEVILTPLIILGLWFFRRDLRVRTGLLAWFSTFGFMTLIFPFAGVRGGFFHSGAALQPLFWAVAPVGLLQFVEWGKRVRNWDPKTAQRVFGVALLCLGISLSAFLTYNRVVGSEHDVLAWSKNADRYALLDQTLKDLGASNFDVVLVNDPPGFFLASNRPSISIPYGNPATLLAAARRYNARYLLLEFNQLQGKDDLYAHPGDRPGFHYLSSVSGVRIYQVFPSFSP